MSDPFFRYIQENKNSLSNHVFGFDCNEKLYDNASYLNLPEIIKPKTSLSEALEDRKTYRDYSGDPLSLEDLSSLLGLSLAERKERVGYPFPSGGGFYPIETYILVNNIDTLKPGLYHYSSKKHSLAEIDYGNYSLTKLSKEMVQLDKPHIPQAIILMTMVKSRCFIKYGSLSYLLSLVEAGHRGQNLCLVSSALDIKICPLGFNEYQKIHDFMQIDGTNEHFIYSLSIGI